MIGAEHFIILALAFVCAFMVSLFTVPLFIKIALIRGILDSPTTLKNHAVATPYLGGLAVYSAFIIVLALFFPGYWNLSFFLIGATLLLLLGLVDDLVPLSALYKFLGQVIAALCFLKGGFSLKHEFIGALSFSISIFLILISFFWILTIVNAFNLIDIMDGLAATAAIGSLIGFLIFALFYEVYSVSLLIVICVGSLFGFFIFNKSPARIYLGDAGSLFIGGLLATIPFMIPWGTYTVFGFFTPLIILAVPIFEVISLIIIRSYKRIPFYLGSRDHFAHYLIDKKWKKSEILLFVSFINSLLICLAFLFNINILSLPTTCTIAVILLVAWCATLYLKFTHLFIDNR